jgi:hypothetical protein
LIQWLSGLLSQSDASGKLRIDQKQILLQNTLKQLDPTMKHLQLVPNGINQNYFTQIIGN